MVLVGKLEAVPGHGSKVSFGLISCGVHSDNRILSGANEAWTRCVFPMFKSSFAFFLVLFPGSDKAFQAKERWMWSYLGTGLCE